MPKIYPGHRLLQFWYVPVAAFLAIGVALGVVWASDQLFGDDTPPVVPVGTTEPTEDPAGGGDQTPDPNATDDPTGTATPEPGEGELAVGDEAVVVGTDPECLNVRISPGTANEPVTCIPDGTEVTVLGGPSEVDNLTWMKIRAPSGEGWAATEYLEKR